MTLKQTLSLVENIGFKQQPFSIPKNKFEYIKRNFYIFILRNISEKLFYFLRNKISPIKYILYDNIKNQASILNIFYILRDKNNNIISELHISKVYKNFYINIY